MLDIVILIVVAVIADGNILNIIEYYGLAPLFTSLVAQRFCRDKYLMEYYHLMR